MTYTEAGQTPYLESSSFEEVDRIEPKRCFAVSQSVRKMDRANTRYLQLLTPEEFQSRLERAEEAILPLSEDDLDAYILSHRKLYTLTRYNSVQWYKGVVHTNEVGVWKGAGGLPVEWTQGSLEETALKVSDALKSSSDSQIAARAKRAIPRMQIHLAIIEQNPYLYPIVLPGATNGRGQFGKPYPGFKVMKGDIDDGCMRSVTLAVNGRTSFNAYVGIKPESLCEQVITDINIY